MTETNKEYIDYLNSLNSYNSKNKNAYSEKNVENDFFKDTSVEIGVSKYIANKLANEEPHVIILTGQAGDGKTSILYQVVNKIAPTYQLKSDVNTFEVRINDNCSCYFIKDFSEIREEERISELKKVLSYENKNKFTFLVANTGPLINTFGALYEKNDSDNAKMKLIKAINESKGELSTIAGHNLSIINMASLDNSSFASKFLEKLVDNKLWTKCSTCEKSKYCPILRNRLLISDDLSTVQQFIVNHYIWLSENGIRLTVRSITEQLSFILTGGKSCRDIRNNRIKNYQLLFPNLFFGLLGFNDDRKALKMIAIDAAHNRPYYNNKLNVDEYLIVKKDYLKVFNQKWTDIVTDIEKEVDMSPVNLEKERYNFYLFLRRVSLFHNILSLNEREAECANIFSKYFTTYIKCRNNTNPVPYKIKNLIIDGLSMIYIGTKTNDEKAPITLNKKSGILQSVQYVTGYLDIDDLEIIKQKTNNGPLNQTEDIYYFYLEVKGHKIEVRLTLPLLDYFNNLSQGIIETDIDPLLSHGIETLKVRISQLTKNKHGNDKIELLMLKNNGSRNKVRLQIEDGRINKV